MYIKFLCKLIFTLILLAICTQAQAKKESFHPGFKTIGIWQTDNNIRIDFNVWYPSIRKPSKVTYGSWKILVAKNGKKAKGIFPVILLSHDSAGGRFSYHSLAAFLAQSGFIVIAPTHYGDNINNMNAIYTIYQMTGRIEHLNIALNAVFNNKFFDGSIDKNNIGVLGFGVGGTAALILGGANLEPKGWVNFCKYAEKHDPYCTPWAKARIEKLIAKLPNLKILPKPQIKAVAIITPSYGMFFDDNSCKNFTAPLLIVKAEEDSINLAPFHADALKDIFYDKAIFATIKKTDSFALMSSCPPDILKDLKSMCTTVSPKQRLAIHSQLYPLIKQFFSNTLHNTDDSTQAISKSN